jgi:hypothetical protein
VPDRIELDGVPALESQAQLASAAVVAASSDEDQLVQIAQVRATQKEKEESGVLEVPLDGDRRAPAPVPPAMVRPPALPRTGLDLPPMAAIGLVMLIAGLAVRGGVSRSALRRGAFSGPS